MTRFGQQLEPAATGAMKVAPWQQVSYVESGYAPAVREIHHYQHSTLQEERQEWHQSSERPRVVGSYD